MNLRINEEKDNYSIYLSLRYFSFTETFVGTISPGGGGGGGGEGTVDSHLKQKGDARRKF